MPELKTFVPAPLIVDSNVAFLESLKTAPEAANLQPYLAESARKAQAILGDEKLNISGIFLNPVIGGEGTVSVIRFSHFHRPSMPIFLICEGTPALTEPEIKRLGVERTFALPLTYAQIKEYSNPSIPVYDENKAIEIAKKNTDKVGDQVAVADTEFVAIQAANYIGGKKSAFDVYIRLSQGKFIKLIQAGDAFLPEKVKEYLAKGVKHFYLRKEAQEVYLAYCDKLATTLLDRKVSVEIKISQTQNQGEETASYLRGTGVNEESLKYASGFVKNVTKLVDTLQPGKYPLVKGFLGDLRSYDHSVSTSMISALLIKRLDMTSSDPIETVGLASIFHDIGMKILNIDPNLEEEKMTEDQKKAYYAHPVEGAKTLVNVRGIKSVVIQAIEQHHERRTRKGFPLKLGPGSLSMVSEIVGLSDEFSHLIGKLKTDPKFNLGAALDKNIIQVFAPALVAEFKKVFFGR